MRRITILIALTGLLFIPVLTQAWNKINGDKEVPNVLEILNAAKYEQIITCVNDEATKTGIVSAFQTLTQSCQPNDIVYIHYSVHWTGERE